jgi:hypothetical protein
MGELDRRAMLGLTAAAMAGSLAACTEPPRPASAAVTTKRRSLRYLIGIRLYRNPAIASTPFSRENVPLLLPRTPCTVN